MKKRKATSVWNGSGKDGEGKLYSKVIVFFFHIQKKV